jgi:hypothetical protein
MPMLKDYLTVIREFHDFLLIHKACIIDIILNMNHRSKTFLSNKSPHLFPLGLDPATPIPNPHPPTRQFGS